MILECCLVKLNYYLFLKSNFPHIKDVLKDIG